jgi:hypothetical protein
MDAAFAEALLKKGLAPEGCGVLVRRPWASPPGGTGSDRAQRPVRGRTRAELKPRTAARSSFVLAQRRLGIISCFD